MTEQLGEKVRRLMRQYGITQAQLADYAGVSQSSISKYLSGVQEPGAEALANIATALHTTSAALLGKPEPTIETPFGFVKEYCARHGGDLSEAEVAELITTLLKARKERNGRD
ncbi:XRE family transcriptional regulator [Bifidobacterium sp. UTCIF-3]|uniref:helix-turn-helix domain-containing protein n=1 Tax=unclassified Bifidobacterium TaxID=2608897 RepID=UPI00112A4FB0|nr:MULTISPECIES: helix-turn-helix transcriptional regulator [unclassified Bifidobacterium]TPF77727.1 XRE family transcriptional regulator [Bifidobacterium sp. UTCIF-1]TPF80096.1 XRE family transcriptional regulator [Bifidobacterium sp. UTCIF-24]TPF81544.1 XRE family transcriptional regulator [Bifidobacterium sp. UTCIF-3]TPF83753.1 XRE family transcriptional regulator [Bifidobacterium sp. UTCIF-36]